MSEGSRFPIEFAAQVAVKVCDRLAPYCERIAIGGSIRRKLSFVGDIELIAIPKIEYRQPTEQLAFAGQGKPIPSEPQPVNLLDEKLEELLEQGWIWNIPKQSDLRRAWGDRYKKFWLLTNNRHGDMKVDLWITSPDSWGAIYTIRTGPSAFSTALVTHIKYYTPYRQQEGSLVRKDTGVVVPVREERAYFNLAGITWIDPEQRTVRELHRAIAAWRTQKAPRSLAGGEQRCDATLSGSVYTDDEAVRASIRERLEAELGVTWAARSWNFSS